MTRHDAERKRKILDVIAATIRARGYPPSVREIAKAVGLASTSAVHHHLMALEREGYLERGVSDDGTSQSRAIRLTPMAALRLGLASELTPQSIPGNSHTLPIIGEIAASVVCRIMTWRRVILTPARVRCSIALSLASTTSCP